MRGIRLRRSTSEALKKNVEQIRDAVRQRAHTLFQTRDGRLGSALDDWLMAEHEALWRPPIEVAQHGNEIVVEAAVAGLEPNEIDVQVTPDTLVIAAERRHAHPTTKGQVHVCEFAPGRLFRSIVLPAPIDPDDVKARYHNGLLTVTAHLASAQPATVKVDH